MTGWTCATVPLFIDTTRKNYFLYFIWDWRQLPHTICDIDLHSFLINIYLKIHVPVNHPSPPPQDQSHCQRVKVTRWSSLTLSERPKGYAYQVRTPYLVYIRSYRQRLQSVDRHRQSDLTHSDSICCVWLTTYIQTDFIKTLRPGHSLQA